MDWKRIIYYNIIYMCVLLSVVLLRLRLDHSVYTILFNVLCFLFMLSTQILKENYKWWRISSVLRFITGYFLTIEWSQALSRDQQCLILAGYKKCPDSTDLTSFNQNKAIIRESKGNKYFWIRTWNILARHAFLDSKMVTLKLYI